MKISLPENPAVRQRNQEYQKTIDTLENCGSKDYDSVLRLAFAYTQRGGQGDCDRALELLQMVSDLGTCDAGWHYYLGKVFFQNGRFFEAAEAAEQSLMLEAENNPAAELLDLCCEVLADTEECDDETITYTEEEAAEVESFIADTFGDFENVFHEIFSPDIHVDICIIPPDDERDFYILVTMGMGAYRMNLPEDFSGEELSRTELAICLPSDWKIFSEEERWYWPIRLLKVLARFPILEKSWLSWGHSIDNGEPFDESTQFCGCMLIQPMFFSDEACFCRLPDGSAVNFFQIIPLYREEIDFKVSHTAEELLDQLDDRVLVVEPGRSPFCTKKLLS